MPKVSWKTNSICLRKCIKMDEGDQSNDGKSLYGKVYSSPYCFACFYTCILMSIEFCVRLRRLLELGVSNFDVCFNLKQGKDPSLILIFCGSFVCLETSRTPELYSSDTFIVMCRLVIWLD